MRGVSVGGSGVCQGETSKITPKLVAGQGLLSTGWAGWNLAAHPVKGGASSGADGSGGHSDARQWNARCGAPVRWCGGWECTASSAAAPVHPMHRTTAPDAGCSAPHRVERTEWSARSTPPWPPLPSCNGRAMEATASTHPRRRPRTVRHGFDRPPGYCRERRQAGCGFGDGYSAVRRRLASARCSRRSRCFGESCIRIRSATGSSSFTGAVPVLSPRPGVCGAGAPGACRVLARRLRCASRRAVTAVDRAPGRDRGAGAAARAAGGGRRRGRRARPGASCLRRCGGGRQRRG